MKPNVLKTDAEIIELRGTRLWTYTTYILSKYLEKKPSKEAGLKFTEFADFVFNVLWRQDKLIFHDGANDLLLDLKYLKKIGIIEFEENANVEKIEVKIKDKAKLKQVAKVVEDSATLTGVELLNAYVQRINKAVESIRVAQ